MTIYTIHMVSGSPYGECIQTEDIPEIWKEELQFIHVKGIFLGRDYDLKSYIVNKSQIRFITVEEDKIASILTKTHTRGA